MIIAVFIISLLIGVPIAIVMGLTAVVHIITTGNFTFFLNVSQRMFAGIDMFSLLCVPLFILAGELMNSGGITKRLTDFARVLIGHVRGGLAYVSILVSTFMAAIVGSATAITAIQCKTLVPEMIKDGYDEDLAVSVSTAGSIIGPIIPPSMIFVVYGVTAGVSIGGMFIAGIIPGLLLGVGFMFLAYLNIKKRNYPKNKRATLSQCINVTLKALPALMLPVIILGGMLGGVFTPTETAGAAVFVSIIVGGFIYKDLEFKKIPAMLANTAVTMASVLIIVSTANVFGWTLAVEQIPQLISKVLLSISTNKYVILLIINIFLLFVGCVMEAFAAIVMLVPVFSPLLAQLNIDPLHFGIVMSVNLIIGMITPPVGICLFVSTSMSNVSIERLSKIIVPYITVSFLILLIITYFPGVITFLPNLLMK
ncbi:TRAP transporter large permease [Petroclostridium sp. X23]|uniref:TRAP transporter large permease n=1 Tax=Petroclostridium sp. X23 TaxID=3045146 RepID=UPI0024AD24A7|nr:TRAP transporter large permease [Petroclostridium sp. X23]WHH59262.1 TRAP transporter large permease [Petroclostridium sp. X23]